ncbi:retrovirus-related pol polyprotein from transposon TNT 1-94 [Tanacetum coccineum]
MDHEETSPDDHTNLPYLKHEQDRSIPHDRPCRNVKAPTRFGDYVAYALQVTKEVESLEPTTYREAITSKDFDMWIAAMGEEIESLHKNKTWELALSESLIYLLLYVDDMLVAAKDMEEVKKLKILLNTEFDMKDLGVARKILGMEIIRDRQHAHAMSVVSRYMAHPEKEHWNTVKCIFRNLKGTSDVGLIYGGDREYLVAGYSDSNYAADLDARRSLTGYVFTVGNSVVRIYQKSQENHKNQASTDTRTEE